jgi:hypothetical protein
MFDPGQMLGGSQSPEQMALPTAQNPGGGPQQMSDPLARGIDLNIAGLKQLAQEAKMNNDEQFSIEIEKFALRLASRKLARQKSIDEAYASAQAAQVNMQF